MTPDEFQQAWQSPTSQPRITINADLLLAAVQRNQQEFRSMIWLRDVRELGVALLLIPVWLILGALVTLPWTWYLMIPSLVGVAAFMLLDRSRHAQPPGPGCDSLLPSVEVSLDQVEHQIWLLRNVLWWYLLPLAVPMLIFFGHVAWNFAVATGQWWAAMLFFALLVAFGLAVDAFIYWANQHAVRTELEPRRQELCAIVASLQEDPSGAGAAEQVIRMQGLACENESSWRTFLAALGIAIALLAAGLGLFFLGYLFDGGGTLGDDPTKRSPFTAVRWQDSQPEVNVAGEWFKLLSLDGVPAAEIVAFSQRAYHDKWQKRFEEDLVELLTAMGHPPADTVELVLLPLDSTMPRTLSAVPMTTANRRLIRDAARARE